MRCLVAHQRCELSVAIEFSSMKPPKVVDVGLRVQNQKRKFVYTLRDGASIINSTNALWTTLLAFLTKGSNLIMKSEREYERKQFSFHRHENAPHHAACQKFRSAEKTTSCCSYTFHTVDRITPFSTSSEPCRRAGQEIGKTLRTCLTQRYLEKKKIFRRNRGMCFVHGSVVRISRKKATAKLVKLQ